jgi:hypothetical protein
MIPRLLYKLDNVDKTNDHALRLISNKLTAFSIRLGFKTTLHSSLNSIHPQINVQ